MILKSSNISTFPNFLHNFSYYQIFPSAYIWHNFVFVIPQIAYFFFLMPYLCCTFPVYLLTHHFLYFLEPDCGRKLKLADIHQALIRLKIIGLPSMNAFRKSLEWSFSKANLIFPPGSLSHSISVSYVLLWCSLKMFLIWNCLQNNPYNTIEVMGVFLAFISLHLPPAAKMWAHTMLPQCQTDMKRIKQLTKGTSLPWMWIVSFWIKFQVSEKLHYMQWFI